MTPRSETALRTLIVDDEPLAIERMRHCPPDAPVLKQWPVEVETHRHHAVRPTRGPGPSQHPDVGRGT